MRPIEIVTAGWYNFFYVLAVVVAGAAMLQAGRRRGVSATGWVIACGAWIVGGVMGAMVPHLVLGDLAAPRTALGAIAGATLALVLAARALRLPIRQTLDSTAIAIPLGGAIVRIGCFLAGCCQGTVTSLPIGIALHSDDAARHPVQLYEATLEGVLAVVLARWLRKKTRRPGEALLTSIGSIAAIRFITEFVRDNEKFGGLSFAQWIVFPVGVLCLAALASRRRIEVKALSRSLGLSRAALVAAASTLLVLALIDRLPPLETSMVLLAFGAFGLAIAHRVRASVPAGLAVLALQMPVISPDSTFPRSFKSFGGGFTMGSYDQHHLQSNCDSGTTEDWTRHHSFSAAAVEIGTRRYSNPTRWSGFRLAGHYDADQAGRATVKVGTPKRGSYTTQSGGVSAIGDFDWKNFGFSFGVTAGAMRPMWNDGEEDPSDPIGAMPAIGLRIGPMQGISFEAHVADETPTWIPGPSSTATLGFGDKHGNRFRVGVSDVGLFISTRHLSGSGIEILPSMNLGSSDLSHTIQGGVMVRKWIAMKK